MRQVALAAVAALAVAAASCSPQGRVEPLEETGAYLEGNITYGGQPVPLAAVIIVPAGGGAGTTGFADDDGHFKVPNVPPGEVKIGVDTNAAKGPMMGRAMAGSDPKAKGGKRAIPPKIVDVPKKYQSPETSGFQTTINKGSNTFDITIPK
jgi:hypothetical protein